MSKRPWLLIPVFGIALLVWQLLAVPRETAPAAASPAPQQRPALPSNGAADPAGELTPAQVAQPVLGEPTGLRFALESPSVLAVPPAGSAGASLSGEVRLFDRGLALGGAPDGRLTLILFDLPAVASDGSGNSSQPAPNATGKRLEVEVHGGRFQATLPPPPDSRVWGQVRFKSAKFLGRLAFPRPGSVSDTGVYALEPGQPLLLDLTCPSGLTLHVRDAVHHGALTGVRLIENRATFIPLGMHPLEFGEQARLLGDSPVAWPAASQGSGQRQTCFITAEGHAWKRVELDWGQAEDTLVELELAAAIELTVTGVAPTQPAALLLQHLGGPGWAGGGDRVELPLPALGERLTLDRLPPGPYRAKVYSGQFWSPTTVFAQAETELIAGQTVRLGLELAPDPESARVAVSGSLFVPSAWGPLEPAFSLRRLTPEWDSFLDTFHAGRVILRSAPGQPGVYDWSREGVRPGAYLAQVWPSGLAQRIEVPASGLSGLSIRMPEPARGRVRCLNSITREPIENPRISCRLLDGDWSFVGLESQPLKPTSDGEGLELLYGAGVVEFLLEMPQYRLLEPIQTLSPGDQTLELLVAPRGALVIRAQSNGQPVPWPMSLKTISAFQLLAPGGSESLPLSFQGGVLSYYWDQPGEYRLSLPNIPGYEPIEARTITLADPATDLTVELTPLR